MDRNRFKTSAWYGFFLDIEALHEQNSLDSKKCAKTKKPDENLVSLVFLL